MVPAHHVPPGHKGHKKIYASCCVLRGVQGLLPHPVQETPSGSVSVLSRTTFNGQHLFHCVPQRRSCLHDVFKVT